MICRPACGACCTAPSISSAIPGMPDGKPAGVRCIQLDEGNRCRIFGRPERPAVCAGLQPSREMCGDDSAQAMLFLTRLERATAPRPAAQASAGPLPSGLGPLGGQRAKRTWGPFPQNG